MNYNRNIPKKICGECGHEIEERTESYLHVCEQCMNKDEE
jgi:NADH pyrophosphatase NudC (nudix superfamily)